MKRTRSASSFRGQGGSEDSMVSNAHRLPAREGRRHMSLVGAGLALAVALVISLAASGPARAAECWTFSACTGSAQWERMLAHARFNEGNLYRAASDQEYARGNWPAGNLYRAAADQKFNAAALHSIAMDNNNNRGIFLAGNTNNAPNVMNPSIVCVPEDGDPCTASHTRTWHCDTAVHHPTDPDGFGVGRPNTYACEWQRTWVRVCDRHADGRKVLVAWESQFSPGFWWHMWAPPASQGCLQAGALPTQGLIMQYEVCVQNQGCSAPRKVH